MKNNTRGRRVRILELKEEIGRGGGEVHRGVRLVCP